MKLISREEERPFYPNIQLERLRAVTRDLTGKALEVLNRISTHELKKSQPETAMVEDGYLLFHDLD